MFANAVNIINNEINSVSDNPLVFDEDLIVSSGHFHAEHVAMALDSLAFSFSELTIKFSSKTKGLSLTLLISLLTILTALENISLLAPWILLLRLIWRLLLQELVDWVLFIKI